MAYLVLARKYRPQTFTDVVEQQAITQTLSNAIDANRVAHAVLFTGPRGTGKTTIARILAKAMNYEQGPTSHPCNECRSCTEIANSNAADVFEIDGASNNSVEQVRELRSNIKFMPAHSPYKIYIIDEVHMLSPAAFNALLKTLEEPPAHVLFLFATTEPYKIPTTILSRCQRYDLSYVSQAALMNHLRDLCEKEGCPIDNESLEMICRESGGSVRDAMSLLDQVMSSIDKEISYEKVRRILGIMNLDSLFSLAAALLGKDIKMVLTIVDQTFQSGLDIKKFYASVMDHFRNLLMVKLGLDAASLPSLAAFDVERLQKQAETVSDVYLNQILSFLVDEEERIKFSSQPKIAVEVALLKILHQSLALPMDTLIEKIDTLKDSFLGLENGSRSGETSSAASDSARIAKSPAPAGSDDALPGESASPETPLSAPAAAEDLPAPDNPESPAEEAKPSASSRQDPAEIWEQILTIIDKEQPFLGANLTNSTLTFRDENFLEIEVYGSKKNADLLNQKQHKDTLKKVCAEILKRDIDIMLTRKSGTAATKAAPGTTARPDKHPLIAEALEIFGGDIVNTY